jgi:hypothetical protein
VPAAVFATAGGLTEGVSYFFLLRIICFLFFMIIFLFIIKNFPPLFV